MPRKLKVQRVEAIESAMNVFWAKGYNSTSVDDLQNAIGIQRGSFYFHFKDKRSLFFEVLDYYKKTIVDQRRARVRESSSPVEGIQLFFDILLEHLTSNKLNAGCLNTNTATELGFSDKEISERMGLGFTRWQEFWVEILINAKNKKEISDDLDIVSTAQVLVALTQGLNVVARVNPDPNFLNGIVRAGLSIVRKS